MSSIRREDLDLGNPMGHGGQATVFPVRNRRINQQWDAVYKEYSPATRPDLNGDALTRMTEEIKRLPAADAWWLAEKTAWPADLVTHDSQITGFLMRAAPDPFHFQMKSLSGTTSPRVAILEYLLNPDSYVTRIGLNVGPRDRILLLTDIAETISRLHSIDIVVGNLSPKSLLFSVDPGVSCFFIGCDGMRLHEQDVLPRSERPGWEPPDGERAGTPASDAYEFALLAIRLLAGDQQAEDPAVRRGIDPELAELARQGLTSDPAARPTLSTWLPALESAAKHNSHIASLPQQAPLRTTVLPMQTRRPGVTRLKKRYATILIAAVLFVIMGVGAGLASLSPGTEQVGSQQPPGSISTGNTGSTGNIGNTGNTGNTGYKGVMGAGVAAWSVVQEYYSDINGSHYTDAWELLSASMQRKMGPERRWQQGYNTTAKVQVTKKSEFGDKVYVGISADQTDGSTKTYSGSYTVDNGEITGASISGG